MKTFSSYIMEEIDPEFEEVASSIKDIIEKKLPNGWNSVKFLPSLGRSGNTLHVNFGFIGDKSLLTSGYKENDPASASLILRKNGDLYSMEALSKGVGYYTTPEAGSHLAMKFVKIPFRKGSGERKKIILSFEKFLTKYVDTVNKNKENVYNYGKYENKGFFK